MHLVTNRTIHGKRNEDGSELEKVVVKTAFMESDSTDDLLELRALGDGRYVNARVFELVIDDDGMPEIGKEL